MSKPVTLVIFGASGDLTRRKLIPSLFDLFSKRRLPDNLRIAGFSRTPWDIDQFRLEMEKAVQEFGDYEASHWKDFARSLHYMAGDLTVEDDFESLERRLGEWEGEHADRLYYLAVAPRFFDDTVAHLGRAGMAGQSEGWRRVIIEKPFGRDLASAQSLDSVVHSVFGEDQIYRIDHFLGKETAQNILYFRFANIVWEPIWNRNYIDHVQITVAESVDVGRRGGYYDQAGVLRDMFQNHLLQLVTLVTMEPPSPYDATALRNEKVKVLSAIRPIKMENTVQGQYEGYRDAPNVAPDSRTATFAALKFNIDNWRWQDVPFYVRSGKALAEKASEVNIFFKRPPYRMFDAFKEPEANMLSICIQPDEGIHFCFDAKVPDRAQEMRAVVMDFHYDESFDGVELPDAYERLLLDALKGDAALFARSDEIGQAWRLIDPVVQAWETPTAPSLASYARGSWGPRGADELLARDGHIWRMGCREH